MAKIRWRLVMGLASLGAALAITLPANAGTLQAAAGRVTGGSGGVLGDLIWPNCELLDIIWPNASVLGGGLTGGQSSQDAQGNQDNQN